MITSFVYRRGSCCVFFVLVVGVNSAEKSVKWSACVGALKGVDQRIIDEFSGHTTDQQRRRYRHLATKVHRAIQLVFG